MVGALIVMPLRDIVLVSSRRIVNTEDLKGLLVVSSDSSALWQPRRPLLSVPLLAVVVERSIIVPRGVEEEWTTL